MALIWYSGAKQKLIDEKNLNLKILCKSPFNELDIKFLYAPLNTNFIKEINICLQVSEINHFEMI